MIVFIIKWNVKKGPYTGPVLLRQGEPGTSQYIVACQRGGDISLTTEGGLIRRYEVLEYHIGKLHDDIISEISQQGSKITSCYLFHAAWHL